MPVTNTSKQSYKKLTDLGEKQRAVYDLLKKNGGMSDREMAAALDWEINQLLPRRGELADYGFVVKHGEKYVRDTKRNVSVWIATDPIADRQVEKIVGKTETKKEIDPKMKYLLRLKDGKTFTISGAMKQEIEEAMAAKRGNRTVTLANHVFSLSNIAMPIEEYGNAGPLPKAAPVKEEYREVTLIKVDGKWQETNQIESKLKRDRIEYRTQQIGKTTGNIISDLMTVYDGIYDSVRDMRGSNE